MSDEQKYNLLQDIIRKKPQVGEVKTKIPLKNDKYAHLWFDHQDDLDSFDSLMRKKIYYQNSYGEQNDKDFIFNGNKSTFGIFSKDFSERVFTNSQKLKNQLKYLEGLKTDSVTQELLGRRYHSYSDFDQSHEHFKKFGKVGLLWLILRELPLKHFYARSAVTGVFFFYLAGHNWKNLPYFLVGNDQPAMYYPNKFDHQYMDNYPMIKNIIMYKRHTKYNSPGLSEGEVWHNQQFQPFYMHHFKSYRYILRTRRIVPWDGTMNQPIFPYLDNNDRSGLVHNGNNEILERGPNGQW